MSVHSAKINKIIYLLLLFGFLHYTLQICFQILTHLDNVSYEIF